MSREIKFRVWDTQNKRMVYDPYRFIERSEYHRKEFEHTGDYIFYESWTDEDDGISRACFVMQYTGLKDNNGKEIYEGDVIKSPSGHLKKIVWDSARACFSTVDFQEKGGRVGFVAYRAEIIGNIYENPELIKETAGTQ